MNLIDERFLTHRRRSTSIAGMIAAAFSLVLFEYRLLVDGVKNWDLFAVGLLFVVVKLSLMLWYRFKD